MASHARSKTVPPHHACKAQRALFAPAEVESASAEALTAKATLEEHLAQLERLCAQPWDGQTCHFTATAYSGTLGSLIERLGLIERYLSRMRRDLTAEKRRLEIERLREHRKTHPPTIAPTPKPVTVPAELTELTRAAWDAEDYEAFEEWFKRRTFEEDMDELTSSVDRLRQWDFENLREFYEWATQESIHEGGETHAECF